MSYPARAEGLANMVTLTTPHCHSSSWYSSFFCLPGKQTSFVCYLLSHKRVSIKTIFLLLLNEFSLFFELLDNLATNITCQKKIRLNCVNPTLWIFQTQCGHRRIWQSKQSEANVVIMSKIATTSTVTSSHTTLGSVTSMGPHVLQEFYILYSRKSKLGC